MTQELTRDDYAANLNTDFTVEFTPELKVPMKLIEVSEEAEQYGQRSYSLIFQAPGDTPVEQKLMAVEHEKLGRSDLFLVPIAKDGRGLIFQALFNKLVGSPAATPATGD